MYLGAIPKPVLFFKFFLFFFPVLGYTGGPITLPDRSPPFVQHLLRLFVAGGSIVASVADWPFQRLKSVASQRVFPGRAATGLRGRAVHPTFTEAGRKTHMESRPVMVTCSPRVGITLAGVRQARFRRRHIEKPPQAIPARAVA